MGIQGRSVVSGWSGRQERPSEPSAGHGRPTGMKTVRLMLALVALGTGCGADDGPTRQPESSRSPTEQTPAPSSGVDTVAEQEPDPMSDAIADVLGVAAAYRVFDDNSFGGQDVFDRVNVIDSFATPDTYGFLTPDPAAPLLENERAAIEAALDPVAVTWVSSLQAVIGDGTLADYEQVGAVLTLGRPEIDDDVAEVTSNLWCGGDCGIGGTHVLERTASDLWSVTGTTGEQWIS